MMRHKSNMTWIPPTGVGDAVGSGGSLNEVWRQLECRDKHCNGEAIAV
jgi:hypothetical protein